MSRIGKKPILIPEGVEIELNGNIVAIKGPKGLLSYTLRPEMKIAIQEGKILVLPKPEALKKTGNNARQVKKTNAFLGLTHALLVNMINGVTAGYEKKLQIEGIGYRANIEGNDLVLQMGFTHPVKIQAKKDIKFAVEKNIITVFGTDKGLVSQLASKIRKVRPPEPYKGKGIRYVGEIIKKKVGKKAVAAAAK